MVVRASSRPQPGFTLIELLVVIAIIAILIGLLLPAVQRVRESANRSQCQNNLKQLVLAVHAFHSDYGSMPSYFGIFPCSSSNTSDTNTHDVFGGWFAHLLPYVEQESLYSAIVGDITSSGYNSTQTTTVTPASGGTSSPVTETVTNGPVTYTTTGTATTGGTAAVTTSTPHGIWIAQATSATFKVVQCPSDKTNPPNTLVGGWGATSYLANWNAWGGSTSDATAAYGDWGPMDGTVPWGYYAPPQRFVQITDGLSQTILFGEGYGLCNGRQRIALYSASYHNFGLTPSMSNATISSSDLTNYLPVGTTLNYPYGMPNTFLFQTQPLTTPLSNCPAGASCCDYWLAQTPHSEGMTVGMADGSVRLVTPTVSQSTWNCLLQPADGQPPPDW